jgi:endonuclease YncB( thermonuclease family)
MQSMLGLIYNQKHLFEDRKWLWIICLGSKLILILHTNVLAYEATSKIVSIDNKGILILSDKKTARLIGVKISDEDQHCYNEAIKFIRIIANLSTVNIKFLSEKDKEGNYLVYVYYKLVIEPFQWDSSRPSKNSYMLNEDIIKLGYGSVDIEYTFKYSKRFVELENEAKKERTGIWGQGQQCRDAFKIDTNDNIKIDKIDNQGNIFLSDQKTARLIGVKIPDEDQYYYNEAIEFIRKMAKSERVNIEFSSEKDKEGRDRIYIYYKKRGPFLWDSTLPPKIPHEMLNEEIIKLGYGSVDKKYPFNYLKRFVELENEAKKERKGIWR